MSKRKPRFSRIPVGENHDETMMHLADLINIPHIDDYPLRVRVTKEALDMVSALNLNKMTILGIHNYIMHDCDFRGRYRNIEVTVGQDSPPPPQMLNILMEDLIKDLEELSERDYLSDEDIMDWYYRFEKVHPFQDGNGRVGGVICVALSWMHNTYYLVPDDKGDLVYEPSDNDRPN